MFLQKNFDDPVDIPDCHLEWWEMCTSDHPFVAIAAPRAHAKSTCVTHSYVLANICFRQRDFVLIVSDTEAQAKNFLNDVKNELMTNEDIIKVFGIKELIKDMETDFIVRFNDGHEVRVIAKGSEQKLRGLKWNNKRPDLVVCDDIENDDIVMNDDRRRKFRGWFSGALLPCRSSKGIIRIVGTILHLDSQLERLMPNVRLHKKVETTPLRTKNTKYDFWYSAKYKAHNPDFSAILWPEKWTEPELRRIQAMYKAQGEAERYSQEYLNVPLDESTAHFRSSDFLAMDDRDKAMHKIFYVGADLAVTLGQKSDYTCFVVAGVDEDGMLHIVDVIRDRLESPDIIDVIFQLNKKYDPQYFFFEKGSITNSILSVVMLRSQETNQWISQQTYQRVVDKTQFSQAIKARMRSKHVKFDKEGYWYPDFEDELLGFPRKGHDDQVDALAILGHGIHKLDVAPTNKQIMEQEYADEYTNSGLVEFGRCEETGY